MRLAAIKGIVNGDEADMDMLPTSTDDDSDEQSDESCTEQFRGW